MSTDKYLLVISYVPLWDVWVSLIVTQFQLQGWLVRGEIRLSASKQLEDEKATRKVLGGGVSATRSDYTLVTK